MHPGTYVSQLILKSKAKNRDGLHKMRQRPYVLEKLGLSLPLLLPVMAFMPLGMIFFLKHQFGVSKENNSYCVCHL